MTLILDLTVTGAAFLLAWVALVWTPLPKWIAAAIEWRRYRRLGQRVRYREVIAMIESDLARWRSIKDGKP